MAAQEKRQPKSSVTNTTNTSTNAYYVVLDFLEQKPSSDAYWCPKLIAEELGLNCNTVRWALKQLLKDNKVFWVPKGKVHLYASSRRFSDDFSRLMKLHPPKNRYEIHGLTLKITAESLGKKALANAIPVGGVVRDGWKGVGGEGTGETRFQLSAKCLMVWGSFTNLSLDFDRFLVWLARVDGFLAARKWPRIEGQLKLWIVCQFGLNKDYQRFRVDGLVKAFSLQSFEDWFARVYDKELPGGEHVLRTEVHSNHEERSLDQMIALLNGDLSVVEANNLLCTVTEATNNNTKALGEVIKRLGQLSDAIVATRKENIELVNALRELLSFRSVNCPDYPKRQGDKSYVY
ncbi:MAG: hypothetical protein NWF05_04875 [Candidatus Bathyarchaeota archaeon]|nr:hypothetical protein [Candidatus Bathyarchaeota archaeon]